MRNKKPKQSGFLKQVCMLAVQVLYHLVDKQDFHRFCSLNGVFMVSLFFLFGCVEGKTDNSVADSSVEEDPFDIVLEFSSQLQGHFSSQQQASLNSDYYPVSLKTCPISAPELGEDVLYVEQALIGDNPYRQRVYVLEEEDTQNTVRSTVYSLVNERDFVGYCDGEERWIITAEYTKIRQGCHVIMEWDGNGFSGGSEDDSCESTMNGSSYATSIVTTTPDLIEAWDRGWFANGDQAWGAVDGPYLFRRVTEE